MHKLNNGALKIDNMGYLMEFVSEYRLSPVEIYIQKSLSPDKFWKRQAQTYDDQGTICRL